MAVGIGGIGGSLSTAVAKLTRQKANSDKKATAAQDAFDRSQKKSAEKARDAFAAADARLTSDIAGAKAKGDTAAVRELTAKQEGLRAYATASAVRSSETARTTAASGEKALRGAVAKAAQNTQDVMTKADEKLTGQIKAAKEIGDARTVADLTAKQTQLRAAIEKVKTDAAAQGAALTEKLKGTGSSASASSTADATLVAAEKTAARQQKVIDALSARAAANRKAASGSLFRVD